MFKQTSGLLIAWWVCGEGELGTTGSCYHWNHIRCFHSWQGESLNQCANYLHVPGKGRRLFINGSLLLLTWLQYLTPQFAFCPAQVVEDVLKAVFQIKREEVLQMAWASFFVQSASYLQNKVLAKPICEWFFFLNYTKQDLGTHDCPLLEDFLWFYSAGELFLDSFALLGCHQSWNVWHWLECCKSFHIFEWMNHIDDIFIYSNVLNVTHGNCDTNMRISIPFWQSWSQVHLDFIIGDDLLQQSSTLKNT
jgi:hypothetical protein